MEICGSASLVLIYCTGWHWLHRPLFYPRPEESWVTRMEVGGFIQQGHSDKRILIMGTLCRPSHYSHTGRFKAHPTRGSGILKKCDLKLENSVPHQICTKQQKIKQALRIYEPHMQQMENPMLKTNRPNKAGNSKLNSTFSFQYCHFTTFCSSIALNTTKSSSQWGSSL